jgi:hypothetical protein
VTEIPERPDPLARETVRAFVTAAHMGRRDSALLLLEHGPRLEAVTERPEERGPHGISLIDKARSEEALEVVRLLEGHAVAPS